MYLIAEDTVGSTQGWLTLVIQGGAIGILGYHLLISLPQLLKQVAEMMKADRDAFELRNSATIAAMERGFDKLTDHIDVKLDAVKSELSTQTREIVKQTATIKEK